MQLKRNSVIRPIWALLASLTLIFALTFHGASEKAVGRAQSIDDIPSTLVTGRIAFAESGEIFLINADGTGLFQLKSADEGVYYYQPALSPDGSRVVFASAQTGKSEILVINADGTDLRALTSNPYSQDSEPAWSPDGTMIAFVRGFDPTVSGLANSSPSCGSEIYSVNVDGKPTETRLTDGRGGTDPTWSPDGTQLAFVSARDGNLEIYSLTFDNSEIKRLTDTADNEAEPVWSPDGQEIAYARGYISLLTDCGFAHTGLGLPPYVTGSDIYKMSVDGENQIRVTETENNFEPTWSPDGTSLAFISFRDGNSQLYVSDPRYKNEYSITVTVGDKSSPSWR